MIPCTAQVRGTSSSRQNVTNKDLKTNRHNCEVKISRSSAKLSIFLFFAELTIFLFFARKYTFCLIFAFVVERDKMLASSLWKEVVKPTMQSEEKTRQYRQYNTIQYRWYNTDSATKYNTDYRHTIQQPISHNELYAASESEYHWWQGGVGRMAAKQWETPKQIIRGAASWVNILVRQFSYLLCYDPPLT